jgi:hypothetical protein
MMTMTKTTTKTARTRHLRLVRAAAATLLLTAALGCGYPNLRVHNESPYTLEDVRVESGQSMHEFGTLGPGEGSAYVTTGEAVEWPRIEVTIQGERYVFEARPAAGGDLATGYYTYHLRFIEERGTGVLRLSPRFTRDSYPPGS